MNHAAHDTQPESLDPDNNVLVDNFGRRVNYVRISVTDRCDFRCIYCMSENMQFSPRSQILTLEEILDVGRAFTQLGVDKIRITGGEPLVRHNLLWLLERIAELPDLRELVLTTNGSQLKKYAAPLRAAGIKRINISLDSLQPARFHKITRVGELNKVLEGIDAAIAAGFERVKLNSVILRHRNHDEVVPLLRFAMDRGIDISYIEEMPLGTMQTHNRAESLYSSDEVLEALQKYTNLMPSMENTGGPARYFRVKGSETRVGLISPHSHNFCHNCNRVRVTAEGRLMLCLGQEHSVDLREVVRKASNPIRELKTAIQASMAIKPKGHEFTRGAQTVILRHMNVTGG